MRVTWNGSLSFGLVSIPVGLAPATKPAARQSDVSFRLLHRECLTPIKQKRWCPKHDREVTPDELVKGWEVAKGQFVVVEEAELEALERHDDSRTIAIERFVPLADVDPVWMDRTYFLVPGAAPAQRRPYKLLLEAMEEAGVGAIGRFVRSGRESLCLVRTREVELVGLHLGLGHVWRPAPFLVAAGVVATACLVPIVLVTEDGGHGRVFEGVRTYVAQSWRVLRANRDVATFLVCNTAWEGTFAGARTFVVLYVTVGLDEPLSTSTYILAAVAGGYIVAALVAGRIGDRVGLARVISVASAVYGVGLLAGGLGREWHAWYLGLIFVVAIAGGTVMIARRASSPVIDNAASGSSRMYRLSPPNLLAASARNDWPCDCSWSARPP